jgi:hypothetical protein
MKYIANFSLICLFFGINIFSIYCDEFDFNRDIINNNLNFTINIICLSADMNYLTNDNYFEFGVTLGELLFTHKKTNIGLEVSGIKHSVYFYSEVEKDVMKIWFCNPGIYWNMVKNKYITLSPFISINYLTFTTGEMNFDFRELLFRGGIRFTWLIGRVFLPPVIGCEIGYKNTTIESGIYLNLRLSWAL